MREIFKTLLITRLELALSAIMLLCSCGGGGGSTSTSQPPTPGYTTVEPSQSENGLALFGDLATSVGSSVGFVVLSADNQPLTTVNWQQNSGPEVNLLASHTQAIGFDVVQAGNYEFTFTALTSTGEQRSMTFNVAASAATSENHANIRLDHMATERGRASLRVDSSTNKVITQADWQQLGGPQAKDVIYQEDSTGGPLLSLFFAAPEVDEDTVLAFSVTLTFDDGTTASDTALVGINSAAINNNGIFTQTDTFVTSDMIPYRPDSPYAEALSQCVYTNQIVESCSFDELPLIGMQTSNPDIETILNRTLVSHPWMGDRFAEFLQHSVTADDMLKLLRGVTAIVISYDIRPSFYWVRTGAIYLDARNLWRTPQERDSLNTAPDYRSDYGNDLQFGIYWRYVKNDSYYYPQTALAESQRNQRTEDQLEAALGYLMYHELAHANDFFPPSSWAQVNTNETPLSYFQDHAPRSTLLYEEYPLQSDDLTGLAEVSFGGATASSAQRQYTPAQAADEFSADIAPAYYAYYTQREDYATLFEQFMMLYRLEASADIGVIGVNDNPQARLTWGQRHRINQDSLQARVAYVIERVLPSLNVAHIQSELPSPIQLRTGASWYDFASLTDNKTTTPEKTDNTLQKVRPPLRHSQWHQHLRF